MERVMTAADHQFTGRGTLTEGFGLSTEPMPLEPYYSREFFELEQKMIFRRAWLYVCRAEELPEPGNFVVKTIHGTGVEALITHTKAGRIQAFYNSCPHRGSIVVKESAGKASRFSCPYHRWTFENTGDLVGVPDEENFFPSMDKKNCGLAKIATDVWEGWVFINLSPTPQVSLEEYLGPAKEHLGGILYRGAHNPVVYTAVLDANWKTASDAFIESYHIPHIHKKTIGTTFASRLNPFSRLIGARAGHASHHLAFRQPGIYNRPSQPGGSTGIDGAGRQERDRGGCLGRGHTVSRTSCDQPGPFGTLVDGYQPDIPASAH
jgi:phenylpropionate dioxygenase-like ring-hydroxylating dioxygenase large terminal subunit